MGSWWRALFVTDHGPGISAEDQKKLFGMFQQIDSSDTRDKGGSGLGLAISKAIVEQHAGKIGLTSKTDEGSTFWFQLPASPPVKDHQKNATSTTTHRILLVEADDSIVSLITATLGNERFEVTTARTLADAEVLLSKRSKFSAIILDIKLPDGNGIELFDKLRQFADTKLVPVIVMSATQQGSEDYGYPLLIDWITKPLEESRLLHALEVAIASRSPGPARVLIVEDDANARELIKQYLSTVDSDLQYFEAADGDTAIHLARQVEPDLIILDLGLPTTDGFDVVTVLRHENLSRTRLLVHTGRDLSLDEKRRLTLGLSAHLTKSRTSETEFLSAVIQLLNGLVPHSEDSG